MGSSATRTVRVSLDALRRTDSAAAAIDGAAALALDQLDYLLSIPAKISVAELRLDPRWDPLREQARFQKLIAN